MRMREASDEEVNPYEIDVSIGTYTEKSLDSDPFAVTGDDAKSVEGLSAALKRKVSRMNKAYTGDGDAKSKKNEYEDVTVYNIVGAVQPPYNLDYLAKLYEVSSPHYAAVRIKTANIVGLGYDFVESHATREKMASIGDKKRKEAARRRLQRHKSELYAWLDDCNDEDTFEETLQKVWIDYEATGNGYIEIGRKTTGEIGYIGHIPSTTIRVRRNRDGFVQMISNKAVFFRNFGDSKTTDPVGNDPRPNEIIHIKKYSPTTGFYGIPDIIAAKAAVAGNEFAARFNLDYFENKAVPRYVIVVKGATLSVSAERNLHEFFQTGLKGKHHRTLVVPLPADEENRKVDFKMEPVEAGTQDSSFVNYRKGNHSDIFLAHRLPPSKAGFSEGVSLAAARDADKSFKEQVSRPEQRILEKKVNRIVKEKTDAFYLKLNELSLTDEDTQSKIDERYLRMKTVVPNEIRARWGKEPIEGGDEPVDLKPQQAAEARAQAGNSRRRDQERENNATDNDATGRNEQGAGRIAG